MSPLEAAQRALVVVEARTWLRTPYHHRAAVKGGGVDCARILIEIYAEAGLLERFDPGDYPADWFMHRSEERYRDSVEARCQLVDGSEVPIAQRPPGFSVLPGDALLFQHGRTFSHGGIVVSWPHIIHASAPDRSVVLCDVTGHTMGTRRVRIYSVWGRE